MSTIKISPATINLLKNFSTINKSIVIKPGNTISTLSINKNILAKASIIESFPSEIAIYDLGVFLGGLSLFKSPVFDCSDSKKLIVRDENTKAKSVFYYADSSIITTPPEKDIELPSEDIKFSLDTDTLSQLLRAAGVYNVPDMCLYSQDGTLLLSVVDKKNDTSNIFSLPVGESETDDFCFCFKVENLKLLPGSYDVIISKPKVAKFVGKTTDVSYWIALEPDSN